MATVLVRHEVIMANNLI